MALIKHPHVQGGIYGVLLTTNVRRQLFPEPGDQSVFESLLARALQRYRTKVHAYAWLDRQAHLAVQVREVPIGRVMQQAIGPYSRYVSRHYGRPGHHFGRAYQALLLNGIVHLPELVRHIHLAPVRAGRAKDPREYAGSSHCAYLGLRDVHWLTTRLVGVILGRRGFVGPEGYNRFIAQGDASIAESRADDAAFGAWLRQVESQGPALEWIIEAVCRRLALVAQALQSSQRPALPLARALIAWHATRGAGFSLAAVAQRLDRNPSTLHAAMRRHRMLRPRLFEMPLEQLLEGTPPASKVTAPPAGASGSGDR